MRSLGLFIRSSAVRFLAPLGLIVGVIQAFTGGWPHEWDDALRAATNYGLYAVIGSGVGVAVDARALRSRWPSLGSGSRRFAPAVLAVVGAAFWAVAALFLLYVIAMAATAASANFRMPNLLLVAVGIVWVGENVSVGWLVGTYLPLYLAVPAMVLIGWLANALLAYQTDTLPAMFTGVDNGAFGPAYPPSSPVLIAQMLLMVAVSFGCLLLSGLRSRWALKDHLFAALAILLSITAGSSLITTNGTVRERPAETSTSGQCVTDPVPACSTPDDVQARDDMATAAAPMWRSLAAQGIRVPTGVTEEGLSVPDGWAVAPMTDNDRYTRSMALARGTLAFLWCESPAEVIEPNSAEARDRELWLTSHAMTIDPQLFSAGGRVILKRSPAEQVHWVQEQPATVECVTR